MTDFVPDWVAGAPQIIVQVCSECEAAWYLPKPACPRCESTSYDHRVACGEGVCVAATELARSGDGAASVCLVLIELDEGPVVMGRATGAVTPGETVRLYFQQVESPSEESLIPYFTRKS